MSLYEDSNRDLAAMSKDISVCETHIHGLSVSERRFVMACRFTIVTQRLRLTLTQDDWLTDIAARIQRKDSLAVAV